MYQKRPFKGSPRRRQISDEQMVEQFIMRNSDNGYFTRFSTITSKYPISQEKAWNIVGNILSGGKIEAMHDDSGEMKLCRVGTIYKIMAFERKRQSQKRTGMPKPAAGRS